MYRRNGFVGILAGAVALVMVLAPARADLIKQSGSYSRTVLMTSSSDHVTGATGLTLTITLSKAGGSYSSISPTVTELGNGIYSIAYASGNTGTLGALDMHVTASGADATDAHDQVVAFDPADGVGLGLTAVIGAQAYISIDAAHSSSGSAFNLSKAQFDAAMSAIANGDSTTPTAPVASGTATILYYLPGKAKTSGNLVATGTVSYDANKVQTSRSYVFQASLTSLVTTGTPTL